MNKLLRRKEGMELIQAAILIAVAVSLGIIFKGEITSFVNETFSNLDAGNF